MTRTQFIGMSLDRRTRTPFAVLKDPQSDTLLPIPMGPLDAIAVSRAATHKEGDAPTMLDILIDTATCLGGHVSSIIIGSPRDGSFTARINVESSRGVNSIECTPADALAVALHSKAVILASEDVIALAAEACKKAIASLVRKRTFKGSTPKETSEGAAAAIQPTPADVLHEMPLAAGEAELSTEMRIMDDDGPVPDTARLVAVPLEEEGEEESESPRERLRQRAHDLLLAREDPRQARPGLEVDDADGAAKLLRRLRPLSDKPM